MLPSYRPAALSNWAVTVMVSSVSLEERPADAATATASTDATTATTCDDLASEPAHLQSLKYWIMPNCLARPLIAHIHESTSRPLGGVEVHRVAVAGGVGQPAQRKTGPACRVLRSRSSCLAEHVGEFADVLISSVSSSGRSSTTMLLSVSTRLVSAAIIAWNDGAPRDELADQIVALVDQAADVRLLAAQRVADLSRCVLQQRARVGRGGRR